MRSCSLFFLFWWTIFILIAWHQTYKPVKRWRLYRKSNRITKKISLKPVQFESVNVLWLNKISDKVKINIEQTTSPEMGDVFIKKMEMQVFDSESRQNISEVYNIPFEHDRTIEYTHIELLQNDVHLSPYRRLKLYSDINWQFGKNKHRVSHGREGKFIGSVWQEGQELNLSVGLTFLAWAAGIFFLIITRKKSSPRKVRVFVNRTQTLQKGISPKTNIKELIL